MSRRLAIFDCDGTLVDGQANICEAMETAFAQGGRIAPGRAQIRRAVGLSLDRAMHHLLPEADAAEHAVLAEHYREAYRALRSAGAIHEPLFEGIAALIEDLAREGWLLGVATGKSDRGLAHCLAVHGIADRFVTLQTADRHPSKPHPAMIEAALDEAGVANSDATMIGDTSFDMTMARSAGVRALGVSWGYHEPAELTEAGASAVADTAAELGALLRGAR
jgi:phosphoglycolate phosphatase